MAELTWTESVKPYLGTDHELDKLWDEHQELEAQLEELDRVKWLNAEQQKTRRTLQRTKLLGKDKMMALVKDLQYGRQAV